MDAIFNAQVGMAFGIIALLLVIYIVVIGWMRRLGDPSKTPPAQPDLPGADGAPVVRAEAQRAASAAEAGRKKKQLLIQGKDAEIAANVLRRMLSDHDKA